ncbi:MAG: pirin family protein [Flavobacteriales bacterium]
MKTVVHPSHRRGHADHGWLDARHSFSFANWYDPTRIHFGMLRVLNDDVVAAGAGFGMHPHNDMEIITIILQGALQHRDDMGNGSVIRPDDVQVMSAGTGVYHSEFNPSSTDATNLFQLWIFPKEKSIEPRYDQRTFDPMLRNGVLQTVASGLGADGSLYIHQDASISRLRLHAGAEFDYPIARNGNGGYFMVVEGQVEIAGQSAGRRDAVGIWETDKVTLRAATDTELLIIDVPMN